MNETNGPKRWRKVGKKLLGGGGATAVSEMKEGKQCLFARARAKGGEGRCAPGHTAAKEGIGGDRRKGDAERSPPAPLLV